MNIIDETYRDIVNNLYVIQEHFDMPIDWVMETALEISSSVKELTGYDMESEK